MSLALISLLSGYVAAVPLRVGGGSGEVWERVGGLEWEGGWVGREVQHSRRLRRREAGAGGGGRERRGCHGTNRDAYPNSRPVRAVQYFATSEIETSVSFLQPL